MFNKEFNLMLNIYDDKRVSSVTYDKKKDGFVIRLCEKYFRQIYDLKEYSDILYSELNYYIEWLKSLGSKKSMDYLNSLLNLKESFEMNKSLIRYYRNKVENSDTSKVFVKQIDQDTLNYVYKGPYFNRISKVDLEGSNENSGLIQEEYSMSFLKMMGYDYSDIDELLSKFMKNQIQHSFYTKSYVNNVSDVINKNCLNCFDLENGKILAPKPLFERFCLRNRYGEDCVEFRVNTWEQKWYENGSLFKASYCLPYDINYIQKN